MAPHQCSNVAETKYLFSSVAWRTTSNLERVHQHTLLPLLRQWQHPIRSRLMRPGLDAYGLLYVDPNNDRHVNIRGRRNSIDVYLLCAANCSRSFRQLRIPFKLITNSKTFLLERLRNLDVFDMEVIEHE